MKIRIRFALTLLVWGGLAGAEQRLDLEGASVVGSREAPNVLHIVPWQKSAMGELLAPPDMDLDDALAPLDREVFLRRIERFRALHPRQ